MPTRYRKGVTPDLHPQLKPLAFLLGTWVGEGRGHYPTIDDFTYGEENRYWHSGRPFISYTQRTWALDSGQAMHAETGFVRPVGSGVVELVVAHSFGITEVSEGILRGQRLELGSRSLVSTSTAKTVERLARTIDVSGSELEYSLDMEAVGEGFQRHLDARLARSPSSNGS